jgi:PAS domain S-box-containing protein
VVRGLQNKKEVGRGVKSKLRILHLEDDPNDAELIKSTLVEEGFDCDITLVKYREEFLKSIEQDKFDLILIDFSIPSFDGFSALQIAKEKHPDVPVIFVSGTIGEEFAVEIFKKGATDYVLKDRLSKLVPSIERALREVKERADHKRADEALRESEQRFRAIFDNATDGILIVDLLSKKFHSGNKKICQMLGYGEEEIKDIGIMDIHPQEELMHVMEQVERQIRGEISLASDIQVKRKGGRLFYADINSFPIQFLGKSYLVGLFRDVTERKKTEEDLRRINRALKTLSNCNELLIRAKDESTLINNICKVIIDSGGYRMCWVGYAEHDVNKTILPIAHAGYEEDYLKAVKITYADTELGHSPIGITIRTGEIVVFKDIATNQEFSPWRQEALKRGYASIVALPLRSNSHTFGALAIYASEKDAFDKEELKLLEELSNDLSYGIITLRMHAERIQTQEALQKEKAFTESALNTLTDIFFVFDMGGKFLRWNKTMTTILGYTDEDISVMKPTDFFSGEDIQRVAEAIGKVMKEGNASVEAEFVTKDKKKIPYEFSGSLLKDPSGKYISICGVGRDITDRKKFEDELRKREEELKKRVKELEDFYEMGVGRELRMIELKKEIERLKEELGKYKKT